MDADQDRCTSVTTIDTAMGYVDVTCELAPHHGGRHEGHNGTWPCSWTDEEAAEKRRRYGRT